MITPPIAPERTATIVMAESTYRTIDRATIAARRREKVLTAIIGAATFARPLFPHGIRRRIEEGAERAAARRERERATITYAAPLLKEAIQGTNYRRPVIPIRIITGRPPRLRRRRLRARERHPATATECPDCDKATAAAYTIEGTDGITRCWDCANIHHHPPPPPEGRHFAAHEPPPNDQPPGTAGDYAGTRIAVITGHE